jgi:HD-GYP domain-containing protein (c-di-GMP phosphodiesterase class II)
MTELRAGVDIVVYDGLPGTSAPLIRALAESFVVRLGSLDEPPRRGFDGAPLSIFFTSLSSPEAFRRARSHAERLGGATLFVLPERDGDVAGRLRALGAADHLVMPLDPATLCGAARAALDRRLEASWALLDPVQRSALRAGLDGFKACFATICGGEPLPVRRIEESCRLICESTRSRSLADWLSMLRDYHDRSLRHCLLVCGSVTCFASALGIGARDLMALSIGGMVHDIGKVRTPVEILNKPGRLDPGEWDVLRRHPEDAHELLLRDSGLDPGVVEMALHHHERIDGGGYPRGLRGAEISDQVRLLSICDVFVALIERRSYKGRMSSEAALDVMGASLGQLDPDRLRAFRAFVLDQEQSRRSAPAAG